MPKRSVIYIIFALIIIVLAIFTRNIVIKRKIIAAQNQDIIRQPFKSKFHIQPDVIAAYNDFGIKLFKQLQADEKNNCVISPVGVSTSLMMAGYGAYGDTQDQILKATGLDKLEPQTINESNDALISDLSTERKSTEFTATVTASLNIYPGLSLTDEFTNFAKKHYFMQINNLLAATAIASNIQINGMWTSQYADRNTSISEFILPDNSTTKCYLMRAENYYRYYENNKMQLVGIPYGNQSFYLYILLPNNSSTLKQLVNDINASSWNQWINDYSYRRGDVSIPRFSIQSDLRLESAISKLGMQGIFTPEADFRGIFGEQGGWIDAVESHAAFEIDEDGSDADNIKGYQWIDRGNDKKSISKSRFKMLVNRPFVFVVADDRTNAILLIGTVLAP